MITKSHGCSKTLPGSQDYRDRMQLTLRVFIKDYSRKARATASNSSATRQPITGSQPQFCQTQPSA